MGIDMAPVVSRKKKVQQRQGPQETSLAIKLPGQMKMAEAAKQ